MRVIVNEPKLRRNKFLAQVLFFASLGILFVGLLLNASLALSPLFWIVPCGILPLGLLATITSVRLTNEYVRVPHPEDALEGGLKNINRRSILYHYMPSANHVLVTPTGIYALHVLFHSRNFVINGDQWVDSKAKGPLAPLFMFLRQEGIGKPFKDAEMEAAKIQLVVDKALPDAKIEVQPIVVMIGPKVTVEASRPQYPVVYSDPRRRPHLKGLLRDEKKRDIPQLTDEQIDAFHKEMVATAGTAKLTDTDTSLEEDAGE
ncbi:MAG: hypothetical protein KF716_30050 [Anaerolineae bacterium]|nr:hypothetical protein [Anaerolineae bacterium]